MREGDEISPFYDPMIAKLIVHGATREEALARLDAALAQTHIVGVATNVAFLRHVTTSRSFATADLDTALIQREHGALFHTEGLPFVLTAAAVVANILQAERALADADPWSRRNGWRIGGPVTRRIVLEHGDTRETVAFTAVDDRQVRLNVASSAHDLTLAGPGDITVDGRRLHACTYRTGEVFSVFTADGSAAVRLIDPLAHAGDSEAEAGRLTAPMPGKVVAFLVDAGDTVAKGSRWR